MMKFFRKYNKQLLAVFMVGLMIVFVGGSALQGLLTPERNPTVAQSKYGPVTYNDQQHANHQTELLRSLGEDWSRPLGGFHKPLEAVDWIMLQRESAALGTAAEQAAVRSPDIEDRINEVSRKLRVKPDAVYSALAVLRAIQQTASAVGGASSPSEAEVMVAARNALETVSVRAALLPAQAFVDKNQSFTDEELNKQFTAYRDKEPGAGLSFGYYRKAQLKAQYVKIDRSAIAAQVGVANLERKAKSLFEERRAKDPAFKRPGKPPEAAPSEVPDAGSSAAWDPYLTWDEAKDAATKMLRDEQADQAADRLANWIAQYTAESFVEVERGEDGYRKATADAARLDSYDQMIQRIPPAMSFPNAVSVGVTDMFPLEDADKVSELGKTSFRPVSGSPQRFSVLVSRTQAIVPKVPSDEGVNPVDYLSTFQTCSYPLKDGATGNLYLFRIVESKPGGPAESPAEVRERVIADLRLARGFEAAKKRADVLKQNLATETLKEAYQGDPDLAAYQAFGEGPTSGYFEPPPMSRVSRAQAAAGRSPRGVATGTGIGFLPNDVVDACFALEQEADKTKVFELGDRGAVLLVQFVEIKHAQENDFQPLRKTLVQQLAGTRLRSAVDEWFDPQQVRARSQFALVGR